MPKSEDIVKDYLSTGNIKSVALKYDISWKKARKILITEGVYTSKRIKLIQELFMSGMSIEEIAKKLSINPKNVISNLPYTKGRYCENFITENSLKLRKWRMKNKVVPTPDNIDDLTNKNFFNLTVVGYLDNSEWLCKCICGNYIITSTHNLKHGKIHSCGCIWHKALINKYEGKILHDFTVVKYIGSSQWHCINKNKQHVILQTEELKSIIKANTSQKPKGVFYNNKHNIYHAYICIHSHIFNLGYHKHENDAINARKEAEKYRGENFLDWYKDKYPKYYANYAKKNSPGK